MPPTFSNNVDGFNVSGIGRCRGSKGSIGEEAKAEKEDLGEFHCDLIGYRLMICRTDFGVEWYREGK